MASSGQMTAIRGDIEGTNALVQVKIVVVTAVGGDEVDLTPPNTTNDTGDEPDANPGFETFLIISYDDENQYIEDADWTVDFIGKNNSDYILDEDEQAEITVWLHNYDTAASEYKLGVPGTTDQYLTTRLGTNTRFRVELKPGQGSIMTLERTTPPRLQPIVQLN